MQITLQIENVDRLETGGQVSYTCSDRGFDIGRHEHLDWSLPDPHRVISGKHCEVRFEGSAFVLYDMSTNGTFMNGSPNRMDKPHGLKSGDRFMIGDYIISVLLEGADTMQTAPVAEPAGASSGGQWASPFESSPQPAAPQSAGWPASPAPSQDPSYPMPQANSPWGAPEPGMEGRHAPPSDAPGIGTPADDVWSQQGHGWGNADPALYSPQPETPIHQPPRPAQADPMDHLAPHPDLQPSPDLPSPQPSAGSVQMPQDPIPASPFAGEGGSEDPPAPLFGMPDLGETGTDPQQTVADSEPVPMPAPPVEKSPVAAVEPSMPLPPSEPEPTASSPPDPVSSGPEAPAPEPEIPVPDLSAFPADLPAQAETQTGTAVPTSLPPAAVSEQPPVEQPEVTAAVAEVEDSEPLDQQESPQQPLAPKPAIEAASFFKAFADGAGIPLTALDGREPEDLARELGEILSGITGDLMGLLAARSQVKAMTRNANRTMISRSGNNALKFSPTPQAALQTMLSKSAEENGYLPIRKAMSDAFKDIQKHHVWTYSAMQKAAARFENTLSPKAIESEGLVQKSTFGNMKAKQWDRLEERWTSLVGAHDDGLVGVFTQYFTENYEELSRADEREEPGF